MPSCAFQCDCHKERAITLSLVGKTENEVITHFSETSQPLGKKDFALFHQKEQKRLKIQF